MSGLLLFTRRSADKRVVSREKERYGSVTQSSQAQLLCLERAVRIQAETRYLSPSSGPDAGFHS